ncbi:MAG: hypothetical protein HQ510_02020 [Candidatus Marinimicrobia bacterium]|nr:hypothetical protein [Candidatus Neomarinimicrobiota bacterium]
MEILAYLLLSFVLIIWIGMIFFELVSAFPEGALGIIVIIAFSILFIKALKERINNKEDDHYAKTVKK